MGLIEMNSKRCSIHLDTLCHCQAEAERRLGQAKRSAPAGRPGPSPSKRHKPAAVSSDEELSDQDGSEPEGDADMVRAHDTWTFAMLGINADQHGTMALSVNMPEACDVS